MTRAVAYLRKSTGRQATSIDRQRATITAWAESEGVEVVSERVEAPLSGSVRIDCRPALGRALDDVGTLSASALVVDARDRLSRNTDTLGAIAYMLDGMGARVVSADGIGNGTDQMALIVRTFKSIFAQIELMELKRRTRGALRALKADRKKYTGVAPYGWRYVGRDMVRDDAEQRAVVLVHDMRKDGATYAAICECLTAQGHAPRGAKWHANSVRRILAFVPPAARPACGATSPRT